MGYRQLGYNDGAYDEKAGAAMQLEMNAVETMNRNSMGASDSCYDEHKQSTHQCDDRFAAKNGTSLPGTPYGTLRHTTIQSIDADDNFLCFLEAAKVSLSNARHE